MDEKRDGAISVGAESMESQMMKVSQKISCLFVLGLSLLMSGQARAIIVFQDPGRLTTRPTLAGGVNPGWQYVGNYGSFTGIPIGPRAWVTATHLTGTSIGAAGTLNYNNAGQSGATNYASTLAGFQGDLAVMTLNAGQPSFTAWAPVWTDPTNLTTGVSVYMYGRGTERGSPITNGWGWGSGASALSYGTNNVDGFFADPNFNNSILIALDFNQANGNTVPNTEGIFSVGDSGGAEFGYNPATGRWELIGVNSYVDTVQNASGGTVQGAIYDARGYYYTNGQGQLTAIAGPNPVPLSSYATAVSDKISFLQPYMVPEPGTWVMAVVATAGLIMLCRRSA